MMMAFDEHSLWQRIPALPFQEMGDELVVVDPTTRQVHLLNDTAARIWALLAAPQPLTALVETLAEEFEASSADLRVEVEDFLTEMRDKRLCAPRSAER